MFVEPEPVAEEAPAEGAGEGASGGEAPAKEGPKSLQELMGAEEDWDDEEDEEDEEEDWDEE